METEERETLTLAEASRASGLALASLRAAIRRGRLEAEKPGHDWLVTRRALAAYLHSRRTWRSHGRPE